MVQLLSSTFKPYCQQKHSNPLWLLVRQMLAKFQRICLVLNRISVLLSFYLSADVYILLMAADGWHLPRCSGQKLGYYPGLFSCLFLKIEGFSILRQLCSSTLPIQSNPDHYQLLCLLMYLLLTLFLTQVMFLLKHLVPVLQKSIYVYHLNFDWSKIL